MFLDDLMKKLKKVKKPSLKKAPKPIKIKKTNNVNKPTPVKKKSKKKSKLKVLKNKSVSMAAKNTNTIKVNRPNKKKSSTTTKNQTSMTVLIAAILIGVMLAGIVIFMIVKVHEYREKRAIEETVRQFQEEDPSAFIAKNNGCIFWVKDKGVKLKNMDGKVLWEIPILADEYRVIHEEPNLLIVYNIDGDTRIEHYNNSGELESILIQDKVIDIKANRAGEVVVLTEEIGKTYSLQIFTAAGELKKEILRIDAEKFGFPTGVSISPNGTKVAISIINTTSPIVTSNVSIIDVESGKTIEGRVFRDVIAYDVIFSNERSWEILKN